MNSNTDESIRDIRGSSPENIFTVGSNGTIVHYDGNKWTKISSGTEKYLHSIWGSSASDISIVGDDGIILHLEES